ncbi:MAG TPA: hypothetical protein VGM84_00855 [Steroidobacteraceae bacterium]
MLPTTGLTTQARANAGTKGNWLLYGLVSLVALNLAWEHQTILIPEVHVSDYYHLTAREPFIYRALPALLYRVLLGGHADLHTGMNAPFDASYSIFQLIVDALSLSLTFLFIAKIARAFNPDLKPSFLRACAAVVTLVIVIFGYYMVPNRAFFYPYDFPDMCFAAIIFYLCITLRGRAEYWLPAAIFVATLNKETAIFYSGLYFAMRAPNATAAEWRRATIVLCGCAIAFALARNEVMQLIAAYAPHPPSQNVQYEYHLNYTLEQMRNPLFVFAMLNVCSYLYVAVYLLRHRLDRTDVLILLMIAGWFAIMSVVGIVRELRIFVPASLMMFVIIARHLGPVAATWLPRSMIERQPSATLPA